MDTNNLKGLMEAYSEVYAPQEVDEAVKGADPEMRKAASAERRGGDKRLSPSKGKGYADQQKQSISYMDKVTKKNKNVVGLVTKEELDIFDVVLEFLQVEGYAETEQAAIAIMANMSEEWKIAIISEQQLDEISQKTATRAYAASRTGEFEGADSDRDLKRSDNLEKHIKRKFGDKAVKHAERAADAQTFGRKDASGRRKQSPKPRIEKSDYRTTQDGKMHKQDQRELKTNLRIKRDRRLRAKED